MKSPVWMCVAMALLGLSICGCPSPKDKGSADKTQTAQSQDKGADDHGGHTHGPHGGEVFHFDGWDQTGEIKSRTGENVIVIYLLDPNHEKIQPVKADKLVVTESKGKEPKVFEMTADSPGEDGTAGQFSLKDEALAMAVKSLGIEVSLEVDGKTYKAKVPPTTH